MTDAEANPLHGPSFRLAGGLFEANKLVTRFMRPHVRAWVPSEAAKTEEQAVMYGQLLRVDAWLRTLTKLDDPADFQAVASACRGMLETCVDMVLLHQTPDNFQMLIDWEESAKLKHAQCVARFYNDHTSDAVPQHHVTVIEFAQMQASRVEALRRKHGWLDREQKPRHPERWTSRNLQRDTIEADKLGLSFRFERFYETEYRQLCWIVHGSAFAMRGVGPEGFAGIAGMIFPRCSDLGVAASEVLLRHFGKLGEEQLEGFRELREQRNHPATDVWRA